MIKEVQRPKLVVLAGVNGGGKSSLMGALLEETELTWFNPDEYTRMLVREQGLPEDEALAFAWDYGRALLEIAIANGTTHAFETTLGGDTIPSLIAQAAATHDIYIIYCGLATPEKHIERVGLRVTHGGHSIPEKKIRERWESSRRHLIQLLPALARLQVFDNSADAVLGEEIPEPLLVLMVQQQRVIYPDPHDLAELQKTPGWARAIVQAAIELHIAADMAPTPSEETFQP